MVVGNGLTSPNATSSIQVPRGGICVDNDGWCNASTTGRVSAVSYTTGSSDIAENYYSFEPLEAGEIVMTLGGDKVVKAGSSTDPIIGVVSTKPGIILGLDNDISQDNQYPVTLSGRVPVKVNLDGGEIKTGDRITVSNTSGVGMRAGTSSLPAQAASKPSALLWKILTELLCNEPDGTKFYNRRRDREDFDIREFKPVPARLGRRTNNQKSRTKNNGQRNIKSPIWNCESRIWKILWPPLPY